MGTTLQDAVKYLQNGLDITLEQAAGIVGNLQGESGFDPSAIGDAGKAYGLAQWHPDRQANFKKLFNKDIKGSTVKEQLDFLMWELRNTEKNAFEKLLGTGTIADATTSFMKWFERPAAWAQEQSLPGRVEAAKEAANGEGNAGVIDSITGSIGSALTPDWLEDIFSGATAARWTSVLIGIIFIALAVAAFILVRGDDLKSAVVKAAI